MMSNLCFGYGLVGGKGTQHQGLSCDCPCQPSRTAPQWIMSPDHGPDAERTEIMKEEKKEKAWC